MRLTISKKKEHEYQPEGIRRSESILFVQILLFGLHKQQIERKIWLNYLFSLFCRVRSQHFKEDNLSSYQLKQYNFIFLIFSHHCQIIPDKNGFVNFFVFAKIFDCKVRNSRVCYIVSVKLTTKRQNPRYHVVDDYFSTCPRSQWLFQHVSA